MTKEEKIKEIKHRDPYHYEWDPKQKRMLELGMEEWEVYIQPYLQENSSFQIPQWEILHNLVYKKYIPSDLVIEVLKIGIDAIKRPSANMKNAIKQAKLFIKELERKEENE